MAKIAQFTRESVKELRKDLNDALEGLKKKYPNLSVSVGAITFGEFDASTELKIELAHDIPEIRFDLDGVYYEFVGFGESVAFPVLARSMKTGKTAQVHADYLPFLPGSRIDKLTALQSLPNYRNFIKAQLNLKFN